MGCQRPIRSDLPTVERWFFSFFEAFVVNELLIILELGLNVTAVAVAGSKLISPMYARNRLRLGAKKSIAALSVKL